MFAPVYSAEEENKIVVQEWHRQGLVAALTDPNPRTVAAALAEQRNLPLIPATLKTLDEGARQKLVPALEKLLTHSDAPVVQGAAQALGQLGGRTTQNFNVQCAILACGMPQGKPDAPQGMALFRIPRSTNATSVP